MSLSPGTKLGSYKILSALSAGGMGEVYRARDPKLGREIAIKVLPSEMAGNAQRRERDSSVKPRRSRRSITPTSSPSTPSKNPMASTSSPWSSSVGRPSPT